jgi:chemotaxis protein CheC
VIAPTRPPLDLRDEETLRAMASLGAGRAADALGTLVRRGVEARRSQPRMVPCGAVPEAVGALPHGPALVTVRMAVSGSVQGHAVVVLHASDAQVLGTALLGRAVRLAAGHDEGDAWRDDALGASALRECGNILAGAYLGALADATGLALVPSPPVLHAGPASRALPAALRGAGAPGTRVLCVESELHAPGAAPLRAWFLLVPAAASVGALLGARRPA